jgi:hypothetical protein
MFGKIFRGEERGELLLKYNKIDIEQVTYNYFKQAWRDYV